MPDEAIFGASIKDNTSLFFKKLELRLNSVEANQAFDRLENKINKAGRAAGEAAHSKKRGLAGLAVVGGAVAGVVTTALTQIVGKLGEMREQLSEIISLSLTMNQQMESASVLFANFFGGGEEGLKKAEALTAEIRAMATELGISTEEAIGFTKAIAPDAENVGQLKQLITLTDRFADLENKTFGDLQFAMNAAVAGQHRSLRQMLDLGPDVIQSIKKMQDEYGNVDGLVRGLTGYLEERKLGVSSAELMAGTMQQTQKTIAGIRSELILAFGEAPFEIWKEQAADLAKFLGDNQEELIRIAKAFGDVVASVMELGSLIRGGALGNLEMSEVADKVDEITLNIVDLVQQTKAFALVVADLVGPILEAKAGFKEMFPAGFLTPLFDLLAKVDALKPGVDNIKEAIGGPLGWIGLLGKVNEAMRTLNQIIILAGAGWKGLFAGIKPSIDGISLSIQATMAALEGDFEAAGKLSEAASDAVKQGFFDMEAAQDAATVAVLEGNKALEEAEAKVRALAASREDKGTDEEGLADEEVLPGAESRRRREEEKRKAAAKALIDTQIKLSERYITDEIKRQRQFTDFLLGESRRREDIERRRLKSLESIEKNRLKARRDAVKNSGERERELESDIEEKKTKLKKQTAKKNIQVEKDLQRELLRIQREFERSVEEAAIANDAIAFLRAKRQANNKREDALENAKQTKEDEVTTTKERGKELKADIEKQRREFKDDLEERLAAIDEQAKERQVALEESLKAEEEEHAISLQRRDEDMATSLTRQEEDTLRSLDKTLENLKGKHGEYVDVTAAELVKQTKSWKKAYQEGGDVDVTMTQFFERQQENMRQLAEVQAEIDKGHRSRAGGGRTGGFTRGRRRSHVVQEIGQAGLVSGFLASPQRVSLPSPASSVGGGTNISNASSETINFNFQGVEPFLQRIAVRAANEVLRNTLISRR